MMIFATTFHGTETSDLLTTIYLFIALYYVINFRKLYTRNSKLLSFLRSYNLLVLFALLAFQAPLFLCPTLSQSVYIPKAKCQAYQDKLFDDLKPSAIANKTILLYIAVVKSIGLSKIYGIEVSFIVLVLVTEVQNYMFQHPYFRVYVVKHMQEEKQTDGKLRAFMFVERTHLRVLWAYKVIKEEIKVLHQRLLRITQVIREEEGGDGHYKEEEIGLMEEGEEERNSLSSSDSHLPSSLSPASSDPHL